MGVDATRREMLATRAADTETVLLYANAVGGQDGLIYDGGGFVLQNGRRVFEAPRFTAGWWSAVVDLDRTQRLRLENTTWRTDCETALLAGNTVRVIQSDGVTADRSRLAYPVPEGGSFFLPASRTPQVDPRDVALDDLFEALALGVKSYYEKTGAFTSLGIALSGGRDSMLTLLVAWRAASSARSTRDHAFYAKPPLAGGRGGPSGHEVGATSSEHDRRGHRPRIRRRAILGGTPPSRQHARRQARLAGAHESSARSSSRPGT
jgi:hypothetical protein